jgi:hypothetical protein
MKLRIKGDTIRIRLSETEVSSLAEGNSVVEETHFPTSTLIYRVQPSASAVVDFKDNMLQINLTQTEIDAWSSTDEVSISKDIDLLDDNILSILVEKDFKCLTVRPEGESDNYPNPNKHHC